MALGQEARAVLANPNSSPELVRKASKPAPTTEQVIATARRNLEGPRKAPAPRAPRRRQEQPSMKQRVRKFEQSTAMF